MTARHRASTLERRTAVLRSAIELVAERGVAGVTHRDVAARAGVPLGTTTYYFGALDDLIHEALRLVAEEHIAAVEAVTARIADGTEDREAITDQVVEVLLASPQAHVVAQFEIYLDAARRPERRSEVTAVLDAYQEMARVTLEAFGAAHGSQKARLIVALADGLALQRLVRGAKPEDRDELREALALVLQTAEGRA